MALATLAFLSANYGFSSIAKCKELKANEGYDEEPSRPRRRGPSRPIDLTPLPMPPPLALPGSVVAAPDADAGAPEVTTTANGGTKPQAPEPPHVPQRTDPE